MVLNITCLGISTCWDETKFKDTMVTLVQSNIHSARLQCAAESYIGICFLKVLQMEKNCYKLEKIFLRPIVWLFKSIYHIFSNLKVMKVFFSSISQLYWIDIQYLTNYSCVTYMYHLSYPNHVLSDNNCIHRLCETLKSRCVFKVTLVCVYVPVGQC